MSAGQQILNLCEPTSFILFTLASILFSPALVPLVLSRSVNVGEVLPSTLGALKLFRISPWGAHRAYGPLWSNHLRYLSACCFSFERLIRSN